METTNETYGKLLAFLVANQYSPFQMPSNSRPMLWRVQVRTGRKGLLKEILLRPVHRKFFHQTKLTYSRPLASIVLNHRWRFSLSVVVNDSHEDHWPLWQPKVTHTLYQKVVCTVCTVLSIQPINPTKKRSDHQGGPPSNGYPTVISVMIWAIELENASDS